MGRRPGGMTVVFLPEEGGESRSVRLSSRTVLLGLAAGILTLLAFLTMAVSWGFLAMEAGKGRRLAATVDSLESERAQIQNLAEALAEVEAEYEHLRMLFGVDAEQVAPDLWLPPSGLSTARNTGLEEVETQSPPTHWPLTEAGFVTRALVEGDEGSHPGLDIAVATDSYVRASGAGRVIRVGEDPVYGLFVVLEHGDGYQTVYGHLSTLLVERGQSVLAEEVIALSGSTGRSTAAHLHFEILMDGVPLDPLSMVVQPG